MSIQALLTPLLVLALTYLISSNNLSVCIGPVVSSRLLTDREAILLAVIGFLTGLLVEGWNMHFVALPQPRLNEILAVTLAVILLGELARVPISLMYVLTTGLAFSKILTSADAAVLHKFVMALTYWLSSAIIIILVSPLVLNLFRKIGSTKPMKFIALYRLLSITMTFLLCFSFGANNIGLLWSLTGHSVESAIGIILAMLCGIMLTGRRTLMKLAGMYILTPTACLTIMLITFLTSQIATIFKIPISFSVLLVCSLVGVSLAYRIRLIDFKYARRALTVLFLSIPLTIVIVTLLQLLVP